MTTRGMTVNGARAFALSAAGALLSFVAASPAHAADASVGASVAPPATSSTSSVEASVAPPPPASADAPEVEGTGEWQAPPPMHPRKPGLVSEASLGAMFFGGNFKHVAPTAPWIHALVGYEPLSWLMVFGEGELAFTDTSEAVDETRQRAFPIFGFGLGARATWHVTPRFGMYLQGMIDVLEADATKNELGILGYEGAEKLKPAFGGRVGLEWYQRDRHLAFAVSGGLRDATGFAATSGPSDTPLLVDVALNIRYTF